MLKNSEYLFYKQITRVYVPIKFVQSKTAQNNRQSFSFRQFRITSVITINSRTINNMHVQWPISAPASVSRTNFYIFYVYVEYVDRWSPRPRSPRGESYHRRRRCLSRP